MSLTRLRVLVVEDEFLIALHLQCELEEVGVEVVGPTATVRDALRLVEEGSFDVATLDVALKDGPSFPVADALQSASKPFLFVTSHNIVELAQAYPTVVTVPKPILFSRLFAALRLKAGR
ncbi:response regulator [Alsobacter metallidurans]|uniref:Response regulator n=1 Tax=Alsobacter metallidurans TaxID=340221 RepID=A0A917I8X0_9HYPH|nr:response regulator [Alsobacter metallidurans]GGH24633.1 response regulator [Alsobacter metallidurans]